MTQAKMVDSILQTAAIPLDYRAVAQSMEQRKAFTIS
jgi:hypothetical protein